MDEKNGEEVDDREMHTVIHLDVLEKPKGMIGKYASVLIERVASSAVSK